MIMSKRRMGGGSTVLPIPFTNNGLAATTSTLSSIHSPNGTSLRGGKHVSLLMTMAFMVGGVLGHVHGRFYSSSACDSSLPMSASTSSLLSLAATNTCIEKDVDGWHSIRVFYGDTQKHLTPVLETIRSQIVTPTTEAKSDTDADTSKETTVKTDEATTTATLDTQGRMWFAQANQDQVVWALLRQKTNGYFIDLAANDALELSNTVSLEVNAQWRGLCVEPNPMYWYNLTYFRTCHVVAAVVGKTRMEPMYFRYDAGDHGGIVGDRFDNGKRWQRKSLLQYTVPLLEVLQYHQAPRVIDYLSLDVEGAEEFILESFPFDQYTISILTVERPDESLRNLLEQHGYQFLKRLTKWGETLWAHKSVMTQLDLKVLDNFGPPPKVKKIA